MLQCSSAHAWCSTLQILVLRPSTCVGILSVHFSENVGENTNGQDGLHSCPWCPHNVFTRLGVCTHFGRAALAHASQPCTPASALLKHLDNPHRHGNHANNEGKGLLHTHLMTIQYTHDISVPNPFSPCFSWTLVSQGPLFNISNFNTPTHTHLAGAWECGSSPRQPPR